MSLAKGEDDAVDHTNSGGMKKHGALNQDDGSVEIDAAAKENQLVPYQDDGAYEVSQVLPSFHSGSC